MTIQTTAETLAALIRQAKDDALEEAAGALERTISDHAARIVRDLKSPT